MTDLDSLIAKAAYHVYRRYRRWVEPEDIRQELHLWAAEHAKRLQELDEQQIKWRLRDVGEIYARKEKAAKSGYLPEDEVFYSLRALRELLPIAVSNEVVPQPVYDPADKPATRRAASNPGMEWETAVADLRRAFARLSDWHQTVLIDYVYGEGTSEH